MAVSDGGCLASVKRLLLQEPWENPGRASDVICRLLDDSLMGCRGDAARDRPVADAEQKVKVACLFFDFVGYFATAVTSRRCGGAHGAPATDDSGGDLTVGAPPRPHGAAASQRGLRHSVPLPPIHELWRQPSLVAAIERLAEVVWNIQALLHLGDGHVEASRVGRCPLCYAASIEHVPGTDVMWCLLELHAVYRVAEEASSGYERGRTSSLKQAASTNASDEMTLALDVDTRRLLWTHAMAVCRNAVWNGAVQTLRLSVEQWVYGGTHPTLFALARQKSGPAAVQVGGDVVSHSALVLIQCCLLIQDEVAFEVEVRDAAAQATPAGKRQWKGGIRRTLEEARRGNEDDAETASQTSSLTLRGRGDAGLHDSLLALRELSHAAGSAAAFVALTTTAPHYATGGATLLHWVSAKGYECCVRLLLTAWVEVYRDARLPPSVARHVACEEKRVCVDFAQAQTWEAPTDTTTTKAAAAPKTTARAIRCTALQVDDDILPGAVQGGSVAVLRQLLLCGASRHHWEVGAPADEEVLALLLDPGNVLDGVVGTLHERVRDSLCATAAADALASAAWRLWSEKVRKVAADKAGEAAYRRSHDGVMRTALAALEFDPYNPLARTTLRDVLARKVTDVPAVRLPMGEAALEQRRYYQTARRMCEQLLSTRTEREREIQSLLRSVPLPAEATSPPANATTAPMTSDNTFWFLTSSQSGGVSGGGGSPATIATDEQQRPVYALVNLTDPTASPASRTTAMMHPLWVRLPRGVDVQRSLERVGGLYGLVESAMPLIAPVERGDLVVFALRQNFCRFDVTRVVRPQDGAVVEVPCVLQGARDEVKKSILRCAVVPPPVYELDDDRVLGDPLQWLEPASTPTSDVVEQLLNNRRCLQRWLYVALRGRRTSWFHDLPLTPSEASVWRLGTTSNGVDTRLVFATAAFPLAGDAEAGEVDDPLGLTSEAIFVLRSPRTRVVEGDVAFRVAGVFPRWGWGNSS
ncbi:uncharacterized protein Tco025E_05069 [Trypanosoma conorhini]|uniref:Uncharacterized protein n=1 Tax=Trypanosoma conorhini TaxID=83891 RepID=A0A422PHB5_9TRYP|nr:uncharacterized protein Tco025E_05069 [Trypanosoma conorhini]RNF17083.1 hypothetical protein Tco025E_05069 [Trypanosoma conorhini]